MTDSHASKISTSPSPQEIALPETPAPSRIVHAGKGADEVPAELEGDTLAASTGSAQAEDKNALGGLPPPKRSGSSPHPADRTPSQSAAAEKKSADLSDILHESIASIDPTKSHTSFLPVESESAVPEVKKDVEAEQTPAGLSDSSRIPEVPQLPPAQEPVSSVGALALGEQPSGDLKEPKAVEMAKTDSEPNTPTSSEFNTSSSESAASKAAKNKKKKQRQKAKKAADASGAAPLEELDVKDETLDPETGHPTDLAPAPASALVSDMPAAPHVAEQPEQPEQGEVEHIETFVPKDEVATAEAESKAEAVEDKSAAPVESTGDEDVVPPVKTDTLVSDMPTAPHITEAKKDDVPEPVVEAAEEKKESAPAPVTTNTLVSDMPSAAHVEKAATHSGASSPVTTNTLVSDMAAAPHVEQKRAEAVGETADGTPLSEMPIETRHVSDASEVLSPEPTGYISPPVASAVSLHEALKKEDPEAAPAPVATYSPRTQSPDRERRSVSPSPSPSKVASHAKEQETAPTPDVTKPAVERLPEPEPTREAEEATPLDAIPPPEKQVEQAFGLSTLEPEIFPPTPVDAEGQRKLEEQLAEVPPEPAAEETELVAEELGLNKEEAAAPVAAHDEIPAALEEEDKKIELPEPTPETIVAEADAEERTPVLVTPPKEAAEEVAPSPTQSKVQPVFVGAAPSLTGTSKLAELVDEQTPAVEYTPEQLDQRASFDKREASESSIKEEGAPVAPVAAESTEPESASTEAPFPPVFNADETPVAKSAEKQEEEHNHELLGAGALGAAGAGLAGLALSNSSSDANKEKAVEQETDAPVVAERQPEVASAIAPSVFERLDERATDTAGEGEPSSSSVFAEPPTTPMSELSPAAEDNSSTPPAAAEAAVPSSHIKEPSPVATPGEVFAHGDVPAGTLMSPEGVRKEGDEAALEGESAKSPEYFGSSLALPKEVDDAEQTVNSGIPTREPSPPDAVAAAVPAAKEESKLTSSAVPLLPSSASDAHQVLPTPPPVAAASSSNLLSTPVAPLTTDREMEAQPQASSSSTAAAAPLADFAAADPSFTHPTPEPAAKPVADTSNMRWSLKRMTWPDPRVGGERREVRVICQNENGPCSLISLVNVLVLRGSIHIDPAVKTVTYDYLSSLIGDFLIERPPGSSNLTLSSALSILPTTVEGLNVNPSFLSHSAFVPEGDGGELALFELAGVRLTHGWVVESEEDKEVMGRVGSWDAAQAKMVEGQVAEAELEKTGGVTEEGMRKIEDANRIRSFLDSTRTQLTATGLAALSASLEPQEVVAFFRNSHLSVLYKRPSDPASITADEPLLFSLVTDESFRGEPEVVWEPLFASVSQSTGFVNSEFGQASTAGGDVAGMTAEEVARRADREDGAGGQDEDEYDQQLAQQLQSEEDANAAQQLAADGPTPRTSTSQRPAESATAAPAAADKKKEKKEKKSRGCAIM